MKFSILSLLLLLSFSIFGQDEDSVQVIQPEPASDSTSRDSILRIINLNPFFTLHVDSSLAYQLEINKNPSNYFWYLRNSPVGLRINKDNGTLSFKAEKSYFLSGRLKYDVNYKVNVGVQNLFDPTEKIDTSFSIVFYSTEIIPSNVKPTVSGTVWIDEGELLNFKVMCETGSFPFDNLMTVPNMPIIDYKPVQKCGEEFSWTPPYELVKENDSGKVKIIQLSFIGTTKFKSRDTAIVRVVVRDALNYPLAVEEYNQTTRNMERYLLQLKYTFLQLDRRLKKTRTTRTVFDLSSASSSLTGTVLSTSGDDRMGKILPSVGLALVPIKEATAPNKVVDQNQAALLRSSIKRLEYVMRDNQMIGTKDTEIMRKINKLKDELRQIQIQLIDVPIEMTNNLTEEELNQYFNSPRVNKKYRLKGN